MDTDKKIQYPVITAVENGYQVNCGEYRFNPYTKECADLIALAYCKGIDKISKIGIMEPVFKLLAKSALYGFLDHLEAFDSNENSQYLENSDLDYWTDNFADFHADKGESDYSELLTEFSSFEVYDFLSSASDFGNDKFTADPDSMLDNINKIIYGVLDNFVYELKFSDPWSLGRDPVKSLGADPVKA